MQSSETVLVQLEDIYLLSSKYDKNFGIQEHLFLVGNHGHVYIYIYLS